MVGIWLFARGSLMMLGVQTAALAPHAPLGNSAGGLSTGLLSQLNGFDIWASIRPNSIVLNIVAAELQGVRGYSSANQNIASVTGALTGRITGPVRLMQRVTNVWNLSSAELASLLAYPSETMSEALLEGRLTFSADTDRADRARLMYEIHSILADLFVDSVDEGRWIRERSPVLEDMSPLELMLKKRIPGMVHLLSVVESRLANR